MPTTLDLLAPQAELLGAMLPREGYDLLRRVPLSLVLALYPVNQARAQRCLLDMAATHLARRMPEATTRQRLDAVSSTWDRLYGLTMSMVGQIRLDYDGKTLTYIATVERFACWHDDVITARNSRVSWTKWRDKPEMEAAEYDILKNVACALALVWSMPRPESANTPPAWTRLLEIFYCNLLYGN